MNCPVCRQPVPGDGANRPFCSARCRLVDLGRWLGEAYRVPGAAAGEDDPLPAPRLPAPADDPDPETG